MVSSYRIINFILAGVIGLMFIYSGFFYDSNAAVSCVYKTTLGLECMSCGLTRDFNSFLTLNFDHIINEVSHKIFLFFVIQLIMRLFFSLTKKEYVVVDVLLSIVLFLYCFLPLVKF